MHRSVRTLAVLVSVVAGVGLAEVGPADAAQTSYSSCAKLQKDFKHGVSKSKAAAQKQVRQGYGMPAYGTHAQKVYWANESRLDRDKDGTACEG